MIASIPCPYAYRRREDDMEDIVLAATTLALFYALRTMLD